MEDEMKLICKWCGLPYDSAKASSVFCESNPNKGKGRGRAMKHIKREVFVMTMIPSTFTPKQVRAALRS
jgi:hypothetical protein